MPAILSMAVGGGPGAGTGVVIAAVFASIATLAVALSARERRQVSELLEYAPSQEWHPVTDAAGLPPIVAEALLSKRSRLFRRFHAMRLWVSWHQWTEISPGGVYNPATRRWENSTVPATHNLTRYFAALPGTFPDMAVQRRPRPDPSGAGPFERQFVVRPGGEAAVHIPQKLAEALLAQSVPPFRITGNVLIVEFGDRPTQANLSMRSDAIRRLTLLLTPSRQNRG